MDRLIKDKFGANTSYAKILSNFKIYQDYVSKNSDVNFAFEKIVEYLTVHLFVEDRRRKIDELIEANLENVSEAKTHKLYGDYVHHNKSNPNDVFYVIKDFANKCQRFRKRLSEIVPEKYMEFVLEDHLCVNFFKKPVNDFHN
ncbi:MAG: hypothetical protein Harvfovirus88_4, partial [Harvfovirus sp.]